MVVRAPLEDRYGAEGRRGCEKLVATAVPNNGRRYELDLVAEVGIEPVSFPGL
jgi:hypothetical protein